MKRFFPLLYTFFFLSIQLPLSLPAGESPGSLQGDVLERATGQPIQGILVLLPGTEFKAVSNEKGAFLIAGVPPGSYNLKFSGEGYRTWIETDVIVRSGRITYVHVKLDERMPEKQGKKTDSRPGKKRPLGCPII